MMLLKLTGINNRQLLVNLKNVTSFAEVNDIVINELGEEESFRKYTQVNFLTGGTEPVKETLEEILKRYE